MLSGMHDGIGRTLCMIFGPILAIGAALVLWAVISMIQTPVNYLDAATVMSFAAIIFVGFIGVSMTFYAFRKPEKEPEA